jgi:hypothetical protein
MTVLKYIYDYINNVEIIKDNTLMNIHNGRVKDKGFKYIQKYDLSVQGKDSKKTLKEIINICSTCNINIKLQIKLKK